MKLTWTCHSCGEERPDERISVHSYPMKDFPSAERNWRYCNDRSECIDKAIDYGKV